MSTPRLVGWLFIVHRRDGGTEDAIFYAATATEATKLARAWAQRFGYRVEIVLDVDAA